MGRCVAGGASNGRDASAEAARRTAGGWRRPPVVRAGAAGLARVGLSPPHRIGAQVAGPASRVLAVELEAARGACGRKAAGPGGGPAPLAAFVSQAVHCAGAHSVARWRWLVPSTQLAKLRSARRGLRLFLSGGGAAQGVLQGWAALCRCLCSFLQFVRRSRPCGAPVLCRDVCTAVG